MANPAARDIRRLVLSWLYGQFPLSDVSRHSAKDILKVVFMARIEGHLLWRLSEASAISRETGVESHELMALLKTRCRINAARNLQYDTAARTLIRHLDTEKIPVMLIKGTALRARYPALSGRPQCDTDLLIRREHLERAEQLLLDTGYQVDEKSFTREQYLEHHFDLRMIKGEIAIELHWAMANECASGSVDRTWERAEQLDWGGVPVLLPSLADQAVFTLVHLTRHLYANGLLWIGDFLYDLEQRPDLDGQFQMVCSDWPERFVLTPISISRWLAPSGYDHGFRDVWNESRLDQQALHAITESLMFARHWYGIPIWYLYPAIAQWVLGNKKHLFTALPEALLRGAGERLKSGFVPKPTIDQS